MIIASNGYMGIKEIIHEFDDFVKLDDDTQHIVCYDEDRPYFMINDIKYYLDEFIKTNL